MEATDEAATRPSSWANIYAAVPIERATRSIRLLTIHRDAQGDITGHLETYNIGNLAYLPRYIALSYTWDSYELFELGMRRRTDHGTYSIAIQGAKVAIRENLWLALNSILDQGERLVQAGSNKQSRYMKFVNKRNPRVISSLSHGNALFWIDAICINQDDILERNHQVSLMKTIYSNAEFVIAWLGPFWETITSEEADSLISCLRNCAYSSEQRWRNQCDCEPECLFDLRHRASCSIDGDSHVPSTFHDGSPHWAYEQYRGPFPARAIVEHERNIDNHKVCVARSAYWRRMWIIQEVVLPTNIAFMYGSIMLSSDFLVENLQECTGDNPQLNPMHSILHHRNDWRRPDSKNHWWTRQKDLASSSPCQRRPSAKGQYLSLAPLHDSFRLNGCSDQRDRVYALLGLLPQDYPIKADYNTSPCELLLNVFQYECDLVNSGDDVFRAWAEALGLDLSDQDLHRFFRCSRLLYNESLESLATVQASPDHQLVLWGFVDKSILREIEEKRAKLHKRLISSSSVRKREEAMEKFENEEQKSQKDLDKEIEKRGKDVAKEMRKADKEWSKVDEKETKVANRIL